MEELGSKYPQRNLLPTLELDEVRGGRGLRVWKLGGAWSLIRNQPLTQVTAPALLISPTPNLFLVLIGCTYPDPGKCSSLCTQQTRKRWGWMWTQAGPSSLSVIIGCICVFVTWIKQFTFCGQGVQGNQLIIIGSRRQSAPSAHILGICVSSLLKHPLPYRTLLVPISSCKSHPFLLPF